jgi:hypothetical protein
VETNKKLHQCFLLFTNSNMVNLVNNGVHLNWTIQMLIPSMDKMLVHVVLSGFPNFLGLQITFSFSQCLSKNYLV